MIGVNVDAINTTEDRELFRLKMKELDVNVCKGEIAKSFLRGKEIAQEIGFPLVDSVVQRSLVFWWCSGGVLVFWLCSGGVLMFWWCSGVVVFWCGGVLVVVF